MYADDIAITCDTIDQAKNVFLCLKMNASKGGLKINFKKLNILHAGHNSQLRPVTTINEYTLKICNDFLYLGVSTKTSLNVVQEKICRSWFAIGKLRPISISKISDANKMRLFKAEVEAIAAYGLESVSIPPPLCQQIHVPIVKWSRLPWALPSLRLYPLQRSLCRPKKQPLSHAIRKRRLCLVGHVV